MQFLLLKNVIVKKSCKIMQFSIVKTSHCKKIFTTFKTCTPQYPVLIENYILTNRHKNIANSS